LPGTNQQLGMERTMEMVYGIVDYYRGQVYVNQVGDIDRRSAWEIIRQHVPGLPYALTDEHSLTLRREIAECGDLVWEGEVTSIDVTAFGFGGADSGWEPPLVTRRVFKCEFAVLVNYRAEKARREREEREAEYVRREREEAERKEASRRFLSALDLPEGAEVTDREKADGPCWMTYYLSLPGGVKVFPPREGEDELAVCVRYASADFTVSPNHLQILTEWSATLPEVNPPQWWVQDSWRKALGRSKDRTLAERLDKIPWIDTQWSEREVSVRFCNQWDTFNNDEDGRAAVVRWVEKREALFAHLLT